MLWAHITAAPYLGLGAEEVVQEPAATAILLFGPTSGQINFPSGLFEVRANGVITGTITITPTTTGTGVFSPTSVQISAASPVAKFTYTPDALGMVTINATNDAGLDSPGNIEFVAIDLISGGKGDNPRFPAKPLNLPVRKKKVVPEPVRIEEPALVIPEFYFPPAPPPISSLLFNPMPLMTPRRQFKPIEDMTEEEIDAEIASLIKEGLSKETEDRMLTLLSAKVPPT